MDVLQKEFILRDIPLFSDLSSRERAFIETRAILKEYKKGEVVYAQGAPPDAFYCVILGRVEIFSQDAFGNKRILEYLHHGKYFGIISCLTNEPHSVTALAINDSRILVIKKDDFDALLKKIPRLAIDLSRTLSRRLKRRDIHEKTIFESTAIAVYSSLSRVGKTIYALNLALSLRNETKKSVLILDIAPIDTVHSLPLRLEAGDPRVLNLNAYASESRNLNECIVHTRFGIDILCLYYDPVDNTSVKRVVGIMSVLVNDYHYLVMDLPSVMDESIFNILNQSDYIHILSGAEPVDLSRTHKLIDRLSSECNFSHEKIRIIINEYKHSKLGQDEQAEILERSVFATLPKIDFTATDRLVLDAPDSEYAKAVRRIARHAGESIVGLVLGVGVGYGLCHIGVLRVVEKEKIPIDVIAGSSIGALIACLWAIGKDSEEILEITKEFKIPKHIWGLVDLTIPFLGFIKGTKLRNFLKRHLGNKTFYDTRLPLKVIASDVKRKEPRVFDEGLLVDAIMASCAMPGVFTPFTFKEEMLFDGGVTNPLPTEALFKIGVKKIIAVNVTPSREDILRQYEKLKKQITVTLPADIKERRWLHVRNHFRDKFKTNILDIIFSSIEILQSEVANKEALLADVLLHPDTSGLYWLELHRAEEFAKRGEEETYRNIDKIWRLINE